MPKIKLDYNAISANGLDSLDNAVNYLNSVICYLQQNSIPNDFNRYNTLANTISDLKKQRDRLVKFKTWIIGSNNAYDKLISAFELQVLKLPTGRIKKRTSVIR